MQGSDSSAKQPTPVKATPYKAVLIVGKGYDIPDDIRKKFKQKGYLLIGDGQTELDSPSLKADYEKLRGNIDKDTRIYICAHGIARDRELGEDGVYKKGHYVGKKATNEFLKDISGYNPDVPLNIHLNSCFAGAAARDVGELPIGSTLVTHGTADAVTLVDLNYQTILKSSQNLSRTELAQDFMHRFAQNVKQTATISIRKADGSIFKHTLRPPNHMLTIPSEIQRYLEAERSEFIQDYNKVFDKKLIKPEKPITKKEAIEWRNDNFLHSAVIGSDSLIEALNSDIQAFSKFINHALRSGKTALILAAMEGHDRLVSALLKSDKIKANDVREALMEAAHSGHDKALSVLLQSDKIKVNEKDGIGRTPLMLAASHGLDGAISTLLLKSAKVNEINNIGYTALMQAAYGGHEKAVSVLLKSTLIDVNVKDNDGNTALMLAARGGHDKAVSAMLESDKKNVIDVNSKNRYGRTALMWAAEGGHDKVASALLLKSNFIDVNAKDNSGNTALILAACGGHVLLVQNLINSGADLTIKNKKGQTALDLANPQLKEDMEKATLEKQAKDAAAKNDSVQKTPEASKATETQKLPEASKATQAPTPPPKPLSAYGSNHPVVGHFTQKFADNEAGRRTTTIQH